LTLKDFREDFILSAFKIIPRFASTFEEFPQKAIGSLFAKLKDQKV